MTTLDPTGVLIVSSFNVGGKQTCALEFHVPTPPEIHTPFDVNVSKLSILQQSVADWICLNRRSFVITRIADVVTIDMWSQFFSQVSAGLWKQFDEFIQKDINYILSVPVANKRLISGPDRHTSEFVTDDGAVHNRPSVVTNSALRGAVRIDSLMEFVKSWCKFMKTHKHARVGPLKRSKYPALTKEEEEHSIHLQLLHLFVYDCVMYWIVQQVTSQASFDMAMQGAVSLREEWQDTQWLAVQDVVSRSTVVFLQECGPTLLSRLHGAYKCICNGTDGTVIILASSCFSTKKVEIVLWDGEFCIIKVLHHDYGPMYLSSFHGDSDGHLTLPAIKKFASLTSDFPAVMGMDANCGTGKSLLPTDVSEVVSKCLLQHCWVKEWPMTTRKHRSWLQTQTHKTGVLEAQSDDIVFSKHFETAVQGRVSPGVHMLPSKDHPFDHYCVTTALTLKGFS
jgi:hypothetical protein